MKVGGSVHKPAAVDASTTASASGGAPARGRALWRVAGLVMLLALWQAITSLLHVPSYLLPQPTVLVPGFVADRVELLNGLRPLLVEAAGGFVVGNAAGIVLAVAVNRFATAKAAILPLALAIR
ncbi:MAG: hypothetical protein ACYDAG_11630, partial [Chloroflexota bacterium]